jgi:predicted RNase H-like HicB family nuclease
MREFFLDLLGFEVAMDMGWVMTVASPTNRSAQVTIIARHDRRQAGGNLAHQALGEQPEARGHEGRRLMIERRYLIVIEGAEGESFSAYAPDLPGVVATGATELDCEREMRDAIEFHLEGLRQSGQPIPEPSHLTTAYVQVAA